MGGIGGEVEASITQGYVNKYHEGFLGHFLGDVRAMDAGTLTTYHTIDLETDYTV